MAASRCYYICFAFPDHQGHVSIAHADKKRISLSSVKNASISPNFMRVIFKYQRNIPNTAVRAMSTCMSFRNIPTFR